jgi:Domain of unknown function (DUF1078).
MTTTNTETKHTPGPWHVFRMEPEKIRVCYEDGLWADVQNWRVANEGGKNRLIAEVTGYSRPVPRTEGWPTVDNLDEAEANARLMAAAPEMLEALINLIDCYADCFGKPDLDRTNDIINKAMGQ